MNVDWGNSSTGDHGTSIMTRYIVQSSDVIQDMRINVSEEGSETVTWYKERFLSDDEIVDHVVYNPTNTICWTIHRPSKRGWYIRLRCPSFPSGAFIPFVPLPKSSPLYADAALSVSARTNVPQSHPQEPSTQDRVSISSAHSYPPNSPAPAIEPLLPSAARATLEEIGPKSEQLPKRKAQVTQFIMSPCVAQAVQPISTSIFARAFSALKSSTPAHTSSFTLARIPTVAPTCSPPPYTSLEPLIETSKTSSPHALPVILAFHDRTPLLTVRSLTGVIELDKAEERLLGVDTSFWIAVALTYLDFLEERESYLAALHD